MNHKLFVAVIFIGVLINLNCFAYIDPGTTTMIIRGTIWPWLVGIFAVIGGFFFKRFIRPIKKGLTKIWRRIKKKD